MADLTPQEQEIATAVSNALAGKNTEEMSLAGIGDIKKLFCENWATVKQVLEFLANFLPGPLKAAVESIIRIGDLAHGTVCGV